jgi:hypothetical protein
MFVTRSKVALVSGSLSNDLTLGMGATAANPYTPGHWSQSILLRAILGLLFTAGLLFVFRRLTDAVIILAGMDMSAFWGSETGFYVWQPEHFVAVVLGTMLASAGRSNTMVLGAMLGLIVGFIVLLALPGLQMPINVDVWSLLYYILPVWSAAAGALGGKLGEIFWQPPAEKDYRPTTAPLVEHETFGMLNYVRNALFGLVFANIRWLRVLLASLIILAGLWYMNDLLNWLIRYIAGANYDPFQLGIQKRLMVNMVQGAVVIVCAALAGANSQHGLAHGFWVGVIVGVVNLLRYVLFPGPEPLDVTSILGEIGWVWLVSLLAGGFGAMVMPPMAYLAQKRQVNPSNISVPVD